MPSAEVRASSRRKKSRVNVILTPLTDSTLQSKEQHVLSILIKRYDNYNHKNKDNYKSYELEEYFNDKYLLTSILSPFSFLPARFLEQRYLVKAFPKGGGLSSQAKALTLAIARALVKYYPEMRVPLRKANLLTQDSRVKERKKIGKYKARRSPQFTKR